MTQQAGVGTAGRALGARPAGLLARARPWAGLRPPRGIPAPGAAAPRSTAGPQPLLLVPCLAPRPAGPGFGSGPRWGSSGGSASRTRGRCARVGRRRLEVVGRQTGTVNSWETENNRVPGSFCLMCAQ